MNATKSNSSHDPERSGLVVESLLVEQVSSDSIDSSHVRQWVGAEVNRHKVWTRALGSVCALGLVAGLGIALLMSSEASQVRQLVGETRSLALIQFEQVTQEVCQSPPAEYFIWQLNSGKR